MKTYYLVNEEYLSPDLNGALVWIGKSIKGSLFGCLNVPVKQAVEQGYKIRTVKI